MSTRREPQKPQTKTGLEKVGARVRQRAMSGTEASTVGFVLVLYVFAGAGLGYLADKYFETNWIVGAGVLAGSALGFREMFRMIAKINHIEAKASETPEPSQVERSASLQREYSAAQSATKNASDQQSIDVKSAEPEKRKSAFPVPAPPTASFDNPKNNPPSPR